MTERQYNNFERALIAAIYGLILVGLATGFVGVYALADLVL